MEPMLGIGARMLGAAGDRPRSSRPPADGSRAQQKLFELTRRRRGPAETVVITEAEVNALLSRHLVEARGVQLGAPSARLLGGDRIELTGYRPLAGFSRRSPSRRSAACYRRGWREHPVWLRIGAHVRVEEQSPRHLQLDVDALVVGRQRVPALALRFLLDPGGVGLLRWPLSSHIESVTIEPGRAVIRTAS